MTWIVAHSPLPASGGNQRDRLTIHPCYTEQGAKKYAREQVAKGHHVSAQTLEGVRPPRKITFQDISRWLTERNR
ncbi:MAG: hypothetical protein JO188_13160 [Hyphomicrobiales bacterium]|nr:hypothetical protein [Hyphomicrobiales bacterium]